jgi:hypothetical protein
MFGVFRPDFEVVNEGRISQNQKLARSIVGVYFLLPAGPTLNQEVTTSKIVTFFGASLAPGFEGKWVIFDQKMKYFFPRKSIICL